MSPIKTMFGLQGAGFSWQMSEGAFVMQTNNSMERSVDNAETCQRFAVW